MAKPTVAELAALVDKLQATVEELRREARSNGVEHTKFRKEISDSFERDVEHVRADLEKFLLTKVDARASEEHNKATKSLDGLVEGRFKVMFLVAGILFAAILGVGWLKMSSIPAEVESRVAKAAEEVNGRLKHRENQADSHLRAIEARRAAVEGSRLIVLQTDYGTKSYYMGRLKGVIYNINPEARLDIITSEVEDFDIINASFTLWRASRYYPRGTIFVVITNPGGLTSEPIIVLTKNGHIYIGHDNGCFDLVVREHGCEAAYRIASKELTPKRFEDLFGGIDQFAPAAAKLSMGLKLSDTGTRLDEYTFRLPVNELSVMDGALQGSVMDVDKYGNVTTNISADDLKKAGVHLHEDVEVMIRNNASFAAAHKKTYGHVSKGSPVLLVYEGMVQLAINEGSLSAKYQIRRGDVVTIRIKEGLDGS